MIGRGSFLSSVGQLIEISSGVFLRRSSFLQHFFCSRQMLPFSEVQEPEGLVCLRIWGGISSGEMTGLLVAIQSRVIACFCSGYSSNILVYADSGRLSNRPVFLSLSDALVELVGVVFFLGSTNAIARFLQTCFKTLAIGLEIIVDSLLEILQL